MEAVARRDGGWFCHYCGCPLANFWAGQVKDLGDGSVTAPDGFRWPERDHVMPRARGGSNYIGNLVLTCGPCNLAKGKLSYLEFITGWRAAA
jgi:hypothetical protein